MKFTLGWLKDHIETNASLIEICTILSKIGLEVESFVDISEKLKSFTVAHILSTKQHPNAKKLQICLKNKFP